MARPTSRATSRCRRSAPAWRARGSPARRSSGQASDVEGGGHAADRGRVSAPDVPVVGAGFAGAVVAERLATVRGARVLVIDRRDHIAGNAFDAPDEHGVLIHRYGPHIFHTNAEKVFGYLSRFTDWRPYEHRVLAAVGGRLLPMPINRTTLNGLYGLSLSSDEEVRAFYAARAEPRAALYT